MECDYYWWMYKKHDKCSILRNVVIGMEIQDLLSPEQLININNMEMTKMNHLLNTILSTRPKPFTLTLSKVIGDARTIKMYQAAFFKASEKRMVEFLTEYP